MKCRTCNGMGELFTPWDPYENSDWTECGDCDGYGIAVTSDSRRHYAALLAESASVGWPAHFKRDLTLHDRNILEARDPSLPFAWILRECGTQIVTPGRYSRRSLWTGEIKARTEWEDGVTLGRSIIRCLAREGNHRFYWWDGRKLKEVTSETCLDLYSDACQSTDDQDAVSA